MCKRKTNYSSDWEKRYSWIKNVKKDASLAFCKLCDKTFRIDGGSISQMTSHASGQLHLQREKAGLKHSTISLNPSNVSTITKPKVIFLSKESIVKAEILQALETVDFNFPFASANGNRKLFKEIFPNSDIAKGDKQSEAKIQYSIQFGLAPYFMQSLQDDFLGRAFSFKFDDTTTSQVKKQYDGFIQYWSNSMKCIVISYCGSLFVDHCPSETLAKHFFFFFFLSL